MNTQRPPSDHDLNRYGPWIVKKRPSGDWVIDQLDRKLMKARRYGPFENWIEAKEVYLELMKDSQ